MITIDAHKGFCVTIKNTATRVFSCCPSSQKNPHFSPSCLNTSSVYHPSLCASLTQCGSACAPSLGSSPTNITPIAVVIFGGTARGGIKLLVGDEGGEIGLVDTYELFSSNAPSEDKAASVSPTMAGSEGSIKPRGGAKVLSTDTGQDASATITAAATVVLTTPTSVATVERKVRPGEAIVRGFANAMDSFEDSLKATADAEPRSLIEGIPKLPAEKDSSAFTFSAASSSGEQSRTPSSLYKPMVRGLRIGERGSKWRPSSWSCLSLCARKPLIAGIARGIYVPTGFSTSHPDYLQSSSDEDKGSAHVGGEVEPSNHAGWNLQGFAAASVGVEIQIWNYRTKRMLLKHGFVGSSPSSGSYEDIGGGARGVSAVAADKGGQILAFQGGNEGALPIAISLHPSGDYLAVAFRHFINIFYIVGGDGETEDGETSEIDVGESATDTRWASWSSVAVAHAVAAAESAPPATLRSDQRDFLTKGMFSVAGEEDPVVNYDPVSAVHFSNGGQLLAVVTGKVSTRWAVDGLNKHQCSCHIEGLWS